MGTTTRNLHFGDKIYARLCIGGRVVAEITSETIANLSHLISEIRHLACKSRGLARFYVRNLSQGWSEERPLMLYPDRFTRLYSA